MAKKDVTLYDLFEKHASTKAEAMRVYGLVADYDILALDLNSLFDIKGMGRKSALLVVEVVADLKSKK